MLRNLRPKLDNGPHHLMPQDHRQVRWRRSPLDLIELRMTNAASRDLNQDFAGLGNRIGDLLFLQRAGISLQSPDPREQLRFHPSTCRSLF
jgi:hypothetical protein